MPTPEFTIVDDATSSRFTLLLDGEVVSLADYAVHDGVVTIPHVETVPAHRGNGYAETLMDGVIESLREQGRTIRPLCSYAASYMDERPATHELMAR